MGDSLRGKTLVKGHTLTWEGEALVKPSCTEHECLGGSVRKTNTNHGHGLCSCGEMSGHEVTRAARKRWHREHKMRVRTRAL